MSRLKATAERRGTAALLFPVIAVPLAILPAWFPGYDTTPKALILALCAAVLLLLARSWWPGLAELWNDLSGRMYLLLAAGVVLGPVASTIASPSPWLSIGGTVWRRLGAINLGVILIIAVVAAASVAGSRFEAARILRGMEIAGCAAAGYAILQYAGVDPLIPAQVYTTRYTSDIVRPPATLGNATYFATFLLPALLTAVSRRFQEKRSALRRVHEAAFVLMLVALATSGTRSAWLGLLAGLVVLGVLEGKRWLSEGRLKGTAIGVVVFCISAGVFLMLPPSRDVRLRMRQWTQDAAGGPRLMVWRDSLPLLRSHPLLGVGPERFEPEFRRIQSLALSRAYPDFYHESPHNFLLEIASTQGCVGLLTWVSLLVQGFWCGIRARRRGVPAAAPAMAALAAMLVSLQFVPLTLTNTLYVLLLTSVLVGLAVAPPPESAPIQNRARWLCGVAALVILFGGACGAVQDITYAVVENRMLAGDLQGVQTWYEGARRNPLPGPDLRISRELVSLARHSPVLRQASLQLAREASAAAELRGEEGFEALYQSAMLEIMSRDFNGAEAKLRQAIEASPVWYRPRVALANLLWATGRQGEAEQEAAAALNCAGKNSTEVKEDLDAARAGRK